MPFALQGNGMKKTIIFSLALLMAGTAFASDGLKQAINGTYKFQSGERFCSAVALDKVIPNQPNVTILLTAKHCIDTEHSEGGFIIQEKSSETGSSSQLTKFKVLGISKESDLAAIIVNDPSFNPDKVHIADGSPDEGDQVWSIGYTLGQTRTTTMGYFGQSELVMTPMGQMEKYNHASTLIDVGNSGGGLFAKEVTTFNGKTIETFELVGIASVKSGPNNFVNGFVSLEDIKKFIDTGA